MATHGGYGTTALACLALLSMAPLHAAPIPPSFEIGAQSGRHDSITHVRMSDGALLWVKILGDAPGKPLVIVHHGAPGVSSHAEPEASFGFLADRYRVLVFDARGSGVSDLKPPYSHARWIKDVEDLRRWAGAEKFVLAGGSYGGFIALDYAVHHADRLSALILRGTSAAGPRLAARSLDLALSAPSHPNAARQKRLWKGKLRSDADFEAAYLEVAPLFAPPAEVALPKAPSGPTAKNLYHAETQNWAFSRNIPAYDVRNELAKINVPTLMTVGRYDRFTNPSDGEEIAQSIAGAKLVVFEHSGHSVPSDEPDRFRRTVNDFLATVSSPPTGAAGPAK